MKSHTSTNSGTGDILLSIIIRKVYIIKFCLLLGSIFCQYISTLYLLDTPSTNTTTDVSIEDVKFENDPAITSSSSLSIPHISTAGTSIITNAGSLMTKADMIGEVDDLSLIHI